MKIILVLFLSVLVSFTHAAEKCDGASAPIFAEYKQLKNGKAVESFNFYRLSDQEVIYDYLDTNIAKYWFKTKNEQVKTSHLFHEFQRLIEYEAADLSGNSKATWEGKFTVLSKGFLSKLKKGQSNNACESTYAGNVKGVHWIVEWSEVLNLPLSIIQTQDKHSVSLKMHHFSEGGKAVSAMKRRIGDYQSTDYADVGDNESDPFLRKMIRLGFVKHGASGFYDSEGNQQSDHGHDH